MILTGRVPAELDRTRLDDAAHQIFPQLSKGEIRRIIDRGGCTVNQTLVRVASRQLREKDEIIIGVMEQERFREVVFTKADMIFENGEYLAINKEPGINSQRTPYQLKGTVEYAVSVYLKSIGSNEPARVIHRLDRGTSGVMFFPKTKKAATHISWRLKQGEVEKIYWAVINGVPDEERWTVDAPITKLSKFRYGVGLPGKPALTDFTIIAQGNNACIIECRPKTGRTHQIRVHLAHSGFPILGDESYCGMPAGRMMLHCRSMAFLTRDDRKIKASAPVDPAFLAICAAHGIEIPAK